MYIYINIYFKQGVDDAASECDLDSIKDWDYIIQNNNESEFDKSLNDLISYLKNFVKINLKSEND
jgi:phosphomevalonate kinase